MTAFGLLAFAAIIALVVLSTSAEGANKAEQNRFVPSPGRSSGEVRINPVDGAEMVWVPAGDFLMGSSDSEIAEAVKTVPGMSAQTADDERPQHSVLLNGYWIYKHPVTVGQYRNFCKSTRRKMPPAPPWGWKSSHPMIYVTWQDAVEYARWAGVSLPTEAQWEKAARGTDGRIYPWGNNWPPPAMVANLADESAKSKHPGVMPIEGYTDGYPEVSPVGKFPAGASPYGCLDMAGNVFEFCSDWYDPEWYSWSSDRNPLGPPYSADLGFNGRHVYRGGSWRSDPDSLRCASRNAYQHHQTQTYIGFRCVANLNRLSGRTFIFNQDSHDVARAMPPGQALEWVREYHRRVFEAGVGVFVADIALPDVVQTRKTPTGEIIGARFGVEYEDRIVGQDAASGPYSRIHYNRRNHELRMQGTDVLQVACEEGRKVGGVVLAGIRMNDAHQGYAWKPESDAPNMSLFMMAHRDWCNTWKTGVADCTLNYAVPEVQAHRLQILREIATNYDIDGLELNWMRWPRHFPEGTQRQHLNDLTHFVSQVRAMLDEVAGEKGVPRLVLGHRVAATVDESLDIGCDVKAWVKLGYADFLSPMDFLQNDPNIRTDEYAALVRDTDCLVYPSFGSLVYSFGPRDGSYRRAAMRNLDQFRATAANWYAWGASGGSCFNMYLWEPRHQDFYTQAVAIMSNPKKALSGPRHYVYLPTWKDHSGGIGPTGRMNAQSLTFGPDSLGKRQAFTFRMADGRSGEKLNGVMQVRVYNATPDDKFEIELNGKPIQTGRLRIDYRPQGETGGQPASGVKIPDDGTFDWPPHLKIEIELEDCPAFCGDNELSLTMVSADAARTKTPVMEALEVLVR